MKLILEKLSRYWQLRFLVVGGGTLLVVYAVVMPVHSDESIDQPVAPATISLQPDASASSSTGSIGKSRNASAPAPIWLGENTEAAAQFNLAAESDQTAELPRDFSESIRQLRKAAEQGNIAAEFLLGHAYETGFGVPKDMTETARWYTKAAASAVVAGLSTPPEPQSFAQALDFYRNAAEQGNASAELYIGLAYDLGQDLPRSAGKAAAWYRKAAQQGSPSAASNLGVLYYDGDGMPKDGEEAAIWFGRAANQGNALAQYSLGRMYYQGDGVPQSYTEASRWLNKAAIQGSAPAQVLLGAMCATGKGVPGNTAMAYMWLNLASASEEQAKISRDQVEKLIPEEQIAEGQKLTHEWLAEHPRYTR